VIYRVFKEYDIDDKPIWEWECDCEKCLTTPYQCLGVVIANYEERENPQDTALYPSLRR